MTVQKKKWEAWIYSSIGLILMFFLLVGVNAIASAIRARLDLTENQINTLSPGTRAILKKIKNPVTIRFYYTESSPDMPIELKDYARKISDMLADYRQASGGKIQIQKLDPEPDSDAEDSAHLDGIDGQMIGLDQKIYLGLSFSCLDQKDKIAFLSPRRQNLLEYDITRAISRVITTEKPVIGVMTALPMFGHPMNPMMARMGQRSQPPWIIIQQLKGQYTVRQIPMDTDKIADDIKLLMVVYPKGISDKAQYAIDQFVMRGGKLIAFLDPLSLVDSRSGSSNPFQGINSSNATLDKLLKAWKVNFDVNKVVADMQYPSYVQRNGQEQEMPSVLSLTTDAINQKDPVTSHINKILLPFAGAFTGTPADGLKETVLLKSSKQSQLIDRFTAEFTTAQNMKDFTASGTQYALAIRLVGKFKTAFPNGEPKGTNSNQSADPPSSTNSSPASLKESSKQTAVILVGDSDVLYDQFCAQIQSFLGQNIIIPRNNNLTLAENMADEMAGDIDLVKVRSRGSMSHPFTVVNQMKAQAQAKYQSKIQDLEAKLSQTQQQLNQLQQKKDASQRFIMSPQQQKEISKFRKQEAETNRQLKDVRKNLRRDIDSLQDHLKWINIAGMPFLVTISGITLALVKRKRQSAK